MKKIHPPIAFPPANIKAEVNEKGFSVYPYISLKELSMTIRKDFLSILDAIKYVFLVVLGGGWLLGQEVGFLSVLATGYLTIFIILIARVIWRTKAFIYLNNVIFTDKHLITGYQIDLYQTQRLKKNLTDHAELFDEYLGQKSNLAEKIKNKRNAILSKSAQDLKKVNEHVDLRDGDTGKAAIYFFLLIAAYSLSIIIFYYIGILFVFAFFLVYSFVIKLYLLLFERRELRVKNETETIESKIQTINQIEKETAIKIKQFQGGQIFNLEKYIEQNFGKFYQTIESVFQDQKDLRTYIETQFNKDIIDFDQFEKYIWSKIKIPAQQMEKLLTQVLKNTTKQIRETQSTIKKTTDKHLLGPLEQKIFNLKRMQQTTKVQLTKISKLSNS